MELEFPVSVFPLGDELGTLTPPPFERTEFGLDGMTGWPVGQFFTVGRVVQLAQPIVVLPETVSGNSGTFMPPQSNS